MQASPSSWPYISEGTNPQCSHDSCPCCCLKILFLHCAAAELRSIVRWVIRLQPPSIHACSSGSGGGAEFLTDVVYLLVEESPHRAPNVVGSDAP